MDIRHYRITASPAPYRFPSNGFVLATRGKARLILDGKLLAPEAPYLLHGGQHQCLEIVLNDTCMEYYLILYKNKPEFPYIGRAGHKRAALPPGDQPAFPACLPSGYAAGAGKAHV